MRHHRILSAVLLSICLVVFTTAPSRGGSPPLDPQRLKGELSLARGTSRAASSWPRTIRYPFKTYDFATNRFHRESRSLVMARKPLRIIPHAAGVAEILWAICPRERLVAFNEISADPNSSFIADQVRARGTIFTSRQTELVIGYRPDLVFTVFYSGADFKEKLRQAHIASFDLGHFGDIRSVKEQILLVGQIIGEEGNAGALVKLMDERIRDLKSRLPRRTRPLRLLYYDEGGYIPGVVSNFSSICGMIGAVNVGAEQGIKSWSRIDNETLLKWNPDIIIVPGRSKLKRLLTMDRVLSHARAVKSGAVYEVPDVYLRATSQYMILSADILAGIVYR